MSQQPTPSNRLSVERLFYLIMALSGFAMTLMLLPAVLEPCAPSPLSGPLRPAAGVLGMTLACLGYALLLRRSETLNTALALCLGGTALLALSSLHTVQPEHYATLALLLAVRWGGMGQLPLVLAFIYLLATIGKLGSGSAGNAAYLVSRLSGSWQFTTYVLLLLGPVVEGLLSVALLLGWLRGAGYIMVALHGVLMALLLPGLNLIVLPWNAQFLLLGALVLPQLQSPRYSLRAVVPSAIMAALAALSLAQILPSAFQFNLYGRTKPHVLVSQNGQEQRGNLPFELGLLGIPQDVSRLSLNVTQRCFEQRGLSVRQQEGAPISWTDSDLFTLLFPLERTSP